MTDLSNFPSPQQGVRLVIEPKGHDAYQFTAVIEKVEESGRMQLLIWNVSDESLFSSVQSVSLEYFRNNVVFKMQNRIVQIKDSNLAEKRKPTCTLVLSAPEQIQKIQRRRFPRVSVSVFVKYMSIERPDNYRKNSWKGRRWWQKWKRKLENNSFQAVTETISGSGLRMRTDFPISSDEVLFVCLELPSQDIHLIADVIWKGSKPPQEAPGEAVGLDFKNISETQRQAILSFVAGHQQKKSWFEKID